MTLDQHQAAAAVQAARHLFTQHEADTKTTIIHIEAGAGVDNTLLDLLDTALTNYPPDHSIFVLIERKPLTNS